MCSYVWLASILSTVILATTEICGAGLKKSLLDNMCIDYSRRHVLQVLNMETNCE